eukprot:scaffold1661_cov251-Pinguiococcus_pyrenoidosus.AAC.5
MCRVSHPGVAEEEPGRRVEQAQRYAVSKGVVVAGDAGFQRLRDMPVVHALHTEEVAMQPSRLRRPHRRRHVAQAHDILSEAAAQHQPPPLPRGSRVFHKESAACISPRALGGGMEALLPGTPRLPALGPSLAGCRSARSVVGGVAHGGHLPLPAASARERRQGLFENVLCDGRKVSRDFCSGCRRDWIPR